MTSAPCITSLPYGVRSRSTREACQHATHACWVAGDQHSTCVRIWPFSCLLERELQQLLLKLLLHGDLCIKQREDPVISQRLHDHPCDTPSKARDQRTLHRKSRHHTQGNILGKIKLFLSKGKDE